MITTNTSNNNTGKRPLFTVRFPLLRLSWRNIWRNRRRTLITIASVFFAVFFAVVMIAFSDGSWNRMTENMLRTQTGHIQVHLKGFWNDKVTDNFMTMDAATIARLREIPHVENVSPRVETFAMASSDHLSKGIVVVGIDPEQEAKKSSLHLRLTGGTYLSADDRSVLIGKALSEHLRVQAGDSIALIGQGYHGASAIGLFPVRGVVALMTPEMDGSFLYMSLPAAQTFIDMPDGYSGILIAIDREEALEETAQAVSDVVGTSVYETLTWHKTMEVLLSQAKSDKAFSDMVMYVLYLIVGFGILGTVIMMATERRREFGVVIALGMRRGKLTRCVIIELLLMTFIGTLSAVAASAPVVMYFHRFPVRLSGKMADTMQIYGMEPIVPMEADAMVFVTQALTVLLITCVTMIYPVSMIAKLKVNSAIRS
ncbi:MAG: ABC transporter permease [Bacteroidales bacterium]|jgi:ABC-type lipoprotein release transport system permease subunit|nr:ABC transporter permease [Bacteroidales bacterium]